MRDQVAPAGALDRARVVHADVAGHVAGARDEAGVVEAGRFDLLLTDIVMPEMDGIELAQKASVIDPAIRVMFITGFAAVALKAGRKTPDARVLSKPFHLKDLVAEVERMFQTEDRHGRL